MAQRRDVLIGGGALALLALAGCGGEPPPGPATAAITATGAAGMNPGPDGADRPLTLTVLQLRSAAAFEAADALALQSPEAVLGGDLVAAQQLALAPGGTATANLTLDPSTTALGFVAGFRDPAGKVVRATVPVAPGAALALSASVTAAGLAVAPA